MDLSKWREVLDNRGECLPSVNDLEKFYRRHRRRISPDVLERTAQALGLRHTRKVAFMQGHIAVIPVTFEIEDSNAELMLLFPSATDVLDEQIKLLWRVDQVSLEFCSEVVQDFLSELEKFVLPARAHAGDDH